MSESESQPTIRELHGRWKCHEKPETLIAYLNRAAELMVALPFAFRPAEPATSDIGHIQLLEDFSSGRLVRQKGALLCGEKRFASLMLSDRPATCLACLEIAARLVERKTDG